ncbi:hypothetical protein [Salirhabdus salicampi]|uniref:hypothetical protein n=1 Tax=Salirhabdus salicampi TaxID=476102 RepID=UPI0020C57EEC|nr:hypothetical protein [Salirhabdus salicampi]MCP8617794.1 hypothetical protein [Salirhabdus salicampi]
MKRSKGKPKKYMHLKPTWVSLYEAGNSISSIAKQYNVQIETVSKYISDEVTFVSKSPYRQLIPKWVEERKQGNSFAEIARRYNVSEYAVKSNVKKYMKIDIQDITPTWRRLSKKGYSIKRIANAYNVHSSVVRKALGIELNVSSNSLKLYAPYIEQWVNLYNEGCSYDYIAKKYDVSPNTVYMNIRERVKARRKLTSSHDINQWVETWKELKDKGLSVKTIAEMYDVSPGTIYRRLKKHTD